mgnify:CR=1 FL=1
MFRIRKKQAEKIFAGCPSPIPIAILIMAASGPISTLLFPNQATICRQALRITIWSVPLMAVCEVMYYSLNAAGREKEQAQIGVIATVCHTLCSLTLVLAFGWIGACWSMVFRFAIIAAFRLPDFVRTFLLSSVKTHDCEPNSG